MKIREANAEDIESIKLIIDRNFDEVISQYHSAAIVNKFKEHNSVENLKSQLGWKKIYVAAEENGQVVGTGAFANFGTAESPKYSVSNLYVLPEWHRKGIGAKILEILIGDAQKRNADTLHVPSTRNGVAFYEKFGFAIDKIQPDIDDEITWMTKEL